MSLISAAYAAAGATVADLPADMAALDLTVRAVPARLARETVTREHYLHRAPTVSHAYGLYSAAELVGVVTFGIPASRHLMTGACPSDPTRVIELNRLWLNDSLPRNTASWFVSRALRELPARIVVSFADTGQDHRGYVYRALNFRYAGWSDMERTFPRYDYRRPEQAAHSRDAFRDGLTVADGEFVKVPRSMKVRYWTTTGTRAERAALVGLCAWPDMDWRIEPPPAEWCSLAAYRRAV